MAYNEQLAARIRKVLTNHPADFAVTEKKMFGGLSFLIVGKLSLRRPCQPNSSSVAQSWAR